MAKKERMPRSTLRFNNKIYEAKAIKEAIRDYSKLAEFSLSQTKKYINVEINRIKPKMRDVFVDEFANYVLGLTKRCY